MEYELCSFIGPAALLKALAIAAAAQWINLKENLQF